MAKASAGQVHQDKNLLAAAELEHENLRNLFMQAPSMIAVLRGKDHIFELTNSLYDHTLLANGYKNVIGLPAAKVLPVTSGRRFIKILDNVYKTGEPYIGNEVSIKLDRSGNGTPEEAYFNFVCQPIRDADGNVERIFMQGVEVTELVLEKRAAQHSEERLELSRRVANMGTFEWFFNEQRLIWSDGLEQLYGFSDDFDGRVESLVDRLHPDDRKGFEDAFQKVLADRKPLTAEYRVIWPDGSIHWLVAKGAMHYDPNNEPTSLVGVNIDVTDSKQAAVTQERLEEMIKINQLKDEFISLASHQLRTPATGVKQYLGMVLEGFVGDISDDQQVFLRTAYQSNERQLKIINDLLKTAQLDAERYALKKSLHAVDTLVADVIEEFQPIFDMRDQTVSFKVDQSVGAMIDYDEMRLVVTNLIENASKYSPRGSHLAISVYKKGDKVYMTFKDQGVGIESDQLDKIFDKFTRFDNALSDTVSGSGLGLYWVKRIVTMHSGKIDVKSRVNKGTTFIVRIPENEA